MNRFAITLVMLAAGYAGAEDSDSWTLEVGEDPQTYATVASLTQDSQATIKDEYATKDVHPQLAFRCTLGDATITARIDWRRFISSFNTEVGFKADDKKTLWLKWGVDQSNKITRSPNSDDSQKLIDYLLGAESLSVEVSPYSEPPVTVGYRLAGLADGLAGLRAECT